MKSLQTRFSSMILLALLLGLSACSDKQDMEQLKEAAERGTEAYKLYRTADYATAKAALLDFIRYLEGKMADPSYLHTESAKSDIMTSYARLARLEEKNNGAERESYMQKAIAMCQQLKIKRQCSSLELEAHVSAIDDMFPIN